MEVLNYKVEEGDEFIVLASDGVWDVMTSAETVDFVHQMLRGSVGALPSGEGTRKAVLKMSDWAMKEGDDSDIIQKALSMRKKKMAKVRPLLLQRTRERHIKQPNSNPKLTTRSTSWRNP